MAKIGIMGGTFNPIHHVHLIMAEEARRQFDLGVIWFMPSKNPPHKDKTEIVSDEHRKRMIKHAIQHNPYFLFSDLELKREGTTYTKDTLAFLKKKHPEDEFYFILGGDSLAAMESWCEPAFIFQNCHILAANREQQDNGEITSWISYYEDKYHAEISEIQMPAISISSQMIRKKIQNNHAISDYVPLCVERYIKGNQLYGYHEPLFPDVPSDIEIIKYLSANQKPKRLIHTLGVAMTAANMAEMFNCSARKAYLAGLLHDCAKYLTGREQIQKCEEFDIQLTDIERENTALIHGKLGAHFARTIYHIEDEDILNAITYHTTGRPCMSDLEKIVYLADFMEPGRNMKCKPYSLKEIRKACFSNLDQAMAMVLECSINHLKKSGNPIDTLTIKTYHYYSKKESDKIC